MTTVIGLDPSLTHTAAHWAAGTPGNIQHRGKFALKSKKPQENRFARLHALSHELVERVGDLGAAGRAVCFVEGYSFGSKNAREALGEWGGILRLTMLQLGWDVVEVPPSTLKKFVTGKGNAEKDGIRMEVLKRWDYSSSDNNDSDAYALMRLGVEWVRWSESPANVTKANAELCKKLVVLRAIDLRGTEL